ncbi:MAG: hypothetical protein NXH85_12945 [Pseudomonadaceae bacterium]|nr:hypothetical protein [Pseudomonadaceae bacterium]
MLTLVDGSFLFFRGLHSMEDSIRAPAGEPVNGAFGFAAALLSELSAASATRALVAFDESLGSGYRHALYPQYKANRPLPDDNIRFQLGACQAFCRALSIPHMASSEFEADDILASAASLVAADGGAAVRIVSRDKDLKQLLTDHVHMWDPVSRREHSRASFEEEFGFPPKRFPDYQALVGDSGDNVPGVPGVGAKTAGTLMARYQRLEDVIASVPRWKTDGIKLPPAGKVASSLAEFALRALAMRELLTLRTDVPLASASFDLVAPDDDHIDSMLTQYGLANLRASVNRYRSARFGQ